VTGVESAPDPAMLTTPKPIAQHDPYKAYRDESGRITDPTLLEYRKLLDEYESKATEDFDKTIVALAGGALGTSLVFIEKVVPVGGAQHLWVLAVSWGLLILAVLCNLMSFMSAMQSMRWELQLLDGHRMLSSPDQPAGGTWRKWTNVFNWIAITSCVLGIMLLFTFAALNLAGQVPKPEIQV
jgi:hypothetical protein